MIVLGALVLTSLKDEQSMNKLLEAKNQEILNQRNKVEFLAKKAEEATQEKFKFFMNISHEFRTPLTLILGSTDEWLYNKKRLPKVFGRDLELIHTNALRLLKLVNQLIDFRRIEKGKMALNVQKGNIVELLENIKNAFDRLAYQKKIASLTIFATSKFIS